MCHFVDSERARLTKAFATVIALKWLLFGMNVPMVAQMVLTSKGLSADVTRIGTLVGVRSLVNEQIVGFGELTIAIFADELFLWTCSCRAGDFKWTHTCCGYRW
jgi:hypothetical protein